MAYSTRADVYAIGLPPEVFARSPRPIEGVVRASGTLQLRAHGLATNAPLTLEVISSSIPGATASALPTGLFQGTQYYAQPGASSDVFRVSTSVDGTPIASFADDGVGLFAVQIDHGAYLDQAIAMADALIDANLPNNQGPVNATVMRLISANLAARIYIYAHAAGNPSFAKSLSTPDNWIQKRIDKLLDLWAAGAQLPNGSTDATPTVAENGAVTFDLSGRGFLDCEGDRA